MNDVFAHWQYCFSYITNSVDYTKPSKYTKPVTCSGHESNKKAKGRQWMQNIQDKAQKASQAKQHNVHLCQLPLWSHCYVVETLSGKESFQIFWNWPVTSLLTSEAPGWLADLPVLSCNWSHHANNMTGLWYRWHNIGILLIFELKRQISPWISLLFFLTLQDEVHFYTFCIFSGTKGLDQTTSFSLLF